MTTSAPKLIALTGPAGSGKTTIAKEFVRRRYVHVRFAGPLKAMLRTLGLTHAQVDGDEKEQPCDLLCGKSPRHAMQTIGDQWGRRMIGENLWCNAAMLIVDKLLAEGVNVVIDDCRYANEAQAIAERGGCVFALSRAGSGIRSTHSSETPIPPSFITEFVANEVEPKTVAALILDRYYFAKKYP